MRRLWGVLLIGVAGCCCQLPAINSTPSTAPSTSTTSGGERAAGLKFAKIYFDEALKNPRDADYPWKDIESRRIDDSHWEVSGTVYANNSFNAIVRTRWVAIIRREGDNFGCDALTVDGEEVYRAHGERRGTE